MRRLLVGLITLFVVVLLSGRSMAQSNVLSPDQQSVFDNMDAVLEGNWEGHGDGDGMKFDPQAIACMVNKCSILRSKSSTLSQLRDARNFQTCYAAHMARARSGYTRLANPPPITVLGCNLIAAQAKSTDDRVFAAVNGRPRVQPTAKPRIKHRVANVSIEERAYLLAQVSRPMADDNPYKDDAPKAAPKPRQAQPKAPSPRAKAWNDNPYMDDSPPKAASKPSPARPKLALKPTVTPTAPKASDNPYMDDESKDKLVLISADDRQAVIYVKPGGQFYAIRSSYLAKKYEVDWKAIYTYAGNQYADFIGSCWHGNKVVLDADRMKAKSYDKAKLEGPVDDKFMKACDGEFNFALQAGRTITLPIKGGAIAQAAPAKEPARQPVEQPKQAQVDERPPPAPTGRLEAPPAAPVSNIEVPLETTLPPANSVAAASSSWQPPPADSAAVNGTVSGKEQATSVNWHALDLWFKGWPSTAAVAISLLAVFFAIYELYRRKRPRNKVGQDPPVDQGMVKSDPSPSDEPPPDHDDADGPDSSGQASPESEKWASKLLVDLDKDPSGKARPDEATNVLAYGLDRDPRHNAGIQTPPPRESVKDLKQRVIVRLNESSPDEATVPTRLK